MSLLCGSFLGRPGLIYLGRASLVLMQVFSALVLGRCFLAEHQVWEKTLLLLFSSKEEAVKVSWASL